MVDYFRVTVEDLAEGNTEVVEIAAGDYLLLCFAPCGLAETQTYPAKGRHVLTIRGHSPQGPKREVS